MKLEEVAEVINGVLLTREMNSNGNFYYKLFDWKKYTGEEPKTIYFTSNKIFLKQLTHKNDLVFRLVYPNKIAFIDDDEEFLISSQICIIRPNLKLIDPIFLKWFLESEEGKEELLLNITGSTIQKLTVNSLRKLIIPKINLETQKKIHDLIVLWEKEKENMQTIMLKKTNLYNSIIEEIIEEKMSKNE